METTPPDVYTRRRYILFAVLLILFTAAGFVWGYWLGCEQGKQDMLKILEQRLNYKEQSPA